MAASRAAQKRLTREYKTISENPPPYIVAHPSDSNILEWHYIITGPEDTPYHGGQYWGTLIFPPDYPFKPPAIRMHTPSGRFQQSSRLCLSISDFHPRSFNPAWEVSTILIGLLSFMTSEEMTTGSMTASADERRFHAARSRWWNSTCGGSQTKPGTQGKVLQKGNLKAGDGGAKFRSEWPAVDRENWSWIKAQRIDPYTGNKMPDPAAAAAAASSSASGSSPATGGSTSASASSSGGGGGGCGPQLVMAAGSAGAGGAAGAAGTGTQAQAVVHAVRQGRGAGEGWMGRNGLYMFAGLVFVYVLIARVVNGDAPREN